MEEKECLGKYWQRKIKKISKSDQILAYYQKRIEKDIKNSMDCGQCSAIIFQFSLESSNEITFKNLENDQNNVLWFPYTQLKKDYLTVRYNGFLKIEEGGFLLNFRFKSLLDWIISQGLDFYLTTSLNLVVFWNLQSAKSVNNKNTLYNYFIEQSGNLEEDYKKYQKRIKNAMDCGQGNAYICSLYYGLDYNEMTKEDIVDLDFIFDDSDIKWYLIKEHHKNLVLHFVKKEHLRWFICFPEGDKYTCGLLKIFW
jgi:hypothetical protein